MSSTITHIETRPICEPYLAAIVPLLNWPGCGCAFVNSAHNPTVQRATLAKHLKSRSVHGFAALDDIAIRGYVIYERHNQGREILGLGVHPSWRFQGFGRQLLAHLDRDDGLVTRAFVENSPGDRDAAGFFQALGFSFVSCDDGFLFEK